MKTLTFAAAAAILVGASSGEALGQTIAGTPAIASYHAPGRCLDMRSSDSQVLIWNCHGGSNQAFRFVSGSYGMLSLGDQRCLTSGLISGAPVTVQTCTNAPNQKWGFQANGTLRNESGFCLDIERGVRDNGARILGFSCHGGSNQQFYPAVHARSASIGLANTAQFQGRTDVRSYLIAPGFSGGNIVAAGGGTIVAGGAGNLLANDGGGIVAGGAGNLLARSGNAIVAGGAGNIVAGGAGNLVPGNWSFFSGAGAGVIAAGAGN
jgi:hypothetical protein